MTVRPTRWASVADFVPPRSSKFVLHQSASFEVADEETDAAAVAVLAEVLRRRLRMPSYFAER